jgi:DNA topoisomerase VI subunit B
MVTESANGCRLEAPTKNRLERTAFRTSRLLDFCSRKELIAQTGHQPDAWPLVVLKELVDNALDACEDAGTAPAVAVRVNPGIIEVTDNGPGLPASVLDGVLDFHVRVSSREAYVAPDRGAQGNALKTIVALPFVLDGSCGRMEVEAAGVRHEVTMRVDRIRQTPDLQQQRHPSTVTTGSVIRVYWPELASSILESSRARFLQIADDYTFVNPHLNLTVEWCGECHVRAAGKPDWKKWIPSDPTCAHWYGPEHFERLVSAYLAHDQDVGRDRTVRELVAEFRGLTGTAKQKAVLAEADMARVSLSQLANGDGLDGAALSRLLAAMKKHSKPVKPAALGVIGKEHLGARFEAAGCEMESFGYRKDVGETDGVPWVMETAFAWSPDAQRRRLITGVNWSPGIVNPFRELGRFGQSLDSILEQQRAGTDEPVVLLLHMACPRVEYTDRGKSAVVISGGNDRKGYEAGDLEGEE